VQVPIAQTNLKIGRRKKPIYETNQEKEKKTNLRKFESFGKF